MVQIEGYPRLLTTGTPSAVLAAWQAATHPGAADVTSCSRGLAVHWEQDQRIDPWQPFPQPPILRFSVVPDIDDTDGEVAATIDAFGVDVGKRSGGNESSLIGTMSTVTSTVRVRSESAFGASGVVHIGPEAIGYASTAAQELGTLTRGLYCPFATSAGARFARSHVATDLTTTTGDPIGVSLPPIVSDEPRTWIGRWVAVWICSASASAVDGPDDAHLAFAGTIADVGEGANGETTVECEHALRKIYETRLMANQFTARIAEGVVLVVGASNDFECSTSSSAGDLTADPLTIVSGTPASVNEIQAGRYTVYELGQAINAWLISEHNAGNIGVGVAYEAAAATPSGSRGRISCSDPSASSWPRSVTVKFPTDAIAKFLGWDSGTVVSLANQQAWSIDSPNVPLRVSLYESGNQPVLLTLTNPRGTWIDQKTLLPLPLRDAASVIEGVIGIGAIGNILVRRTSDTIFTRYPSSELSDYLPVGGTGSNGFTTFTVDDDVDLTATQVIVAEASFQSMVLQVLLSTGGTNHNSSTYDKLPSQLGCAIPYSILSDDFVDEIAALDSAAESLIAIVDKPTRFVDLFKEDFRLRWAFIVYRLGRLSIRSWGTPTTGNAVVAIGYDDRAVPPEAVTSDAQRATASESFEFIRNSLAVSYGRDASGELVHNANIVDAESVEAHGPRGEEIKARNTLASSAQGDFIGILSRFSATLPLFSRQHRIIKIPVGPHMFEQLSPGTFVTVDAPEIRDPESGLRYDHRTGTGGMSGWPGVVVANTHDWGGPRHGTHAMPPSVAGMLGEVEILTFDRNTSAEYSPCAQVDNTAAPPFSGGYDSGSKLIRCYAHKHSVAADAVDASRFAVGDQIRIIEIDPDDPANPLTWVREVAAVSSNDIEIDTVLAAPAWNSAKYYRIVPQDYGTVAAGQRATVYQADDADGLVGNARQPYAMVTSGTGQDATFTSAAATELPSRYAELATGDGLPLDTGYASDLAKLANNLVSYKTAPQSPMVATDSRSDTPTGTWVMTEVLPCAVGIGVMFASQARLVYVAPTFRSKTGASVSMRVSLCRDLPQGSSRQDVTLGAAESTTFTTTSTSYTTPTAVGLSIAHLDLSPGATGGLGWLVIETGSANLEYLGLAHMRVGPVVQ